jgi:Uma2 family endonuclease
MEVRMATATAKRGVNYEEFCLLVKDGQKADLIDGVIYMASPDNTDAGEMGFWLARLLADYADYHDLGKIYISRIAFQLSDHHAPEPDVAFVKKDRLNIVDRGRVKGPPDVAIEIVSPDSEDRDYVKKRKLYERFGVTEYWILDEVKETVLWLRRGSKGKYKEVAPKNGILRSTVIPGFWLRPEWLWEKPLPRKSDILSLILKETN